MPPRKSGIGSWEEFVATLAEPESNDLIDAVAVVNPADPAPEDDGWERPQLEKPVPVEPFPVDIYPDVVARLIRQGATSIGCPADFLGMAVLPVAGAAIGQSVNLRIKEGYFVSAAFYVANVGKPGDGKSPALKAVVSPLWRIDEEAHKTYLEEKTEFERAREAYEMAKKDMHRSRTRVTAQHHQSEGGDALDDDGVSEGAESASLPVPPPRPIPRRSVVDNVTTESLAPILSDNPHGVLGVRDEFTALVGSFNQYKSGKGTDRQFYLSAWSGEPITIDRKSNPDQMPIRVPHPFLGLVGGMPPDMLGELAEGKGRDDGFIDRILFAYPDPMPKPGWTKQGIDKQTKTDWADLVRQLWQLPMRVYEGEECPYNINFAPEAEKIWEEWFNDHHAEQNADDFPDWLRGPWAKLEQYAARIALTLHMLHWGADPMRSEAVPDVPPQRMRNAVRLVNYLKSHTHRVRSLMRVKEKGSDGGEHVQTILKWIRRRPVGALLLRTRLDPELPALQRAVQRSSCGPGMASTASLHPPATRTGTARRSQGS